MNRAAKAVAHCSIRSGIPLVILTAYQEKYLFIGTA
jgi:hypothetical protein